MKVVKIGSRSVAFLVPDNCRCYIGKRDKFYVDGDGDKVRYIRSKKGKTKIHVVRGYSYYLPIPTHIQAAYHIEIGKTYEYTCDEKELVINIERIL